MRLVVHIGLHKTASTNLQHLLHHHRDALVGRGVWYAPAPDFAAHHRVTWALQEGVAAPLDALLADARGAGCHTAIYSSENLESGFFEPALFTMIEAAAARAGATIEWHVVLREPGAAFTSLHAQFQHHVYVDPLWMFAEAMNKGGIYMHRPSPNWGGTPYWFFSFDHARHLDAFACGGRRLLAHDYRDDEPFPGWRLLDRLGVLDLIGELPPPHQQNRRLTPDRLHAGFRDRIAEAGGETLVPLVDAAVAVALEAAPACGRLVGERYGDSHARALARYADWSA